MFKNSQVSRRSLLAWVGAALPSIPFGPIAKAANATPDKFEFLSRNGNSSCGADFLNSIATMAPGARIQGSCCSPMERERYHSQVEGLKKYASVQEIAPDPYDVDAGLAQKLLAYYDLQLKPEEQSSYDFAMANSVEKGPCCCRCWRWKVYGGLGKLLIHEKGFDGPKLMEIWNMSDGCGGVENG